MVDVQRTGRFELARQNLRLATDLALLPIRHKALAAFITGWVTR